MASGSPVIDTVPSIQQLTKMFYGRKKDFIYFTRKGAMIFVHISKSRMSRFGFNFMDRVDTVSGKGRVIGMSGEAKIWVHLDKDNGMSHWDNGVDRDTLEKELDWKLIEEDNYIPPLLIAEFARTLPEIDISKLYLGVHQQNSSLRSKDKKGYRGSLNKRLTLHGSFSRENLMVSDLSESPSPGESPIGSPRESRELPDIEVISITNAPTKQKEKEKEPEETLPQSPPPEPKSQSPETTSPRDSERVSPPPSPRHSSSPESKAEQKMSDLEKTLKLYEAKIRDMNLVLRQNEEFLLHKEMHESRMKKEISALKLQLEYLSQKRMQLEDIVMFTEKEINKMNTNQLRELEVSLQKSLSKIAEVKGKLAQREHQLNAEKPSEVKLCKVCGERQQNTILIPCGHSSMCAECAKRATKCPTCKVNIKKRQVIPN